ncbi:hypothetical protein AB4Z38_23825 [Arthrobacter sp. 2RAF6]|uniref:hypothetical protein n=1 Tax=Arthrobacter sp. 2RAF6 TaxID=3233002 RepID=UPI003F912912
MSATHTWPVPALPASAPSIADDAGISVTVWIDPRPVRLLDALPATGIDIGAVGVFAVVALVTGVIAIAISRVRKFEA